MARMLRWVENVENCFPDWWFECLVEVDGEETTFAAAFDSLMEKIHEHD
jgi:hypothetical protein